MLSSATDPLLLGRGLFLARASGRDWSCPPVPGSHVRSQSPLSLLRGACVRPLTPTPGPVEGTRVTCELASLSRCELLGSPVGDESLPVSPTRKQRTESTTKYSLKEASQMALVVKNSPANAEDIRDAGWIPGSGRSPGRGHGTPVLLPGESHGQRSLAGHSPWGPTGRDMPEQLSTHVHWPLRGSTARWKRGPGEDSPRVNRSGYRSTGNRVRVPGSPDPSGGPSFGEKKGKNIQISNYRSHTPGPY